MSFLRPLTHNYSRTFLRMSSSTITPVIAKNAPPAATAYSHAIKANGFVFVSGQIPHTIENKRVEGTFTDKSEQVLQNLFNVLKESGSSLEKIVKVNVFLTDMANFLEFNSVYSKYFDAHRPARSCVAVKQLPLGVEVEVEAIALE